MKRNYWLILALLALLGMVFVPGQAHSAPAVRFPGVSTRISPVSTVRLPVRPIPGPTMIGKPQIQLPSPRMPVVLIPTFETRVLVLEAVARPVAFETAASKAGVFGTARRMLAEKGADSSSLSKAFDNAAPEEAPAVVVDGAKHKPAKDGSVRVTLPESDLEKEIGIF